ncbi:MAG TPA: DUF2165 domain-containing protein [Methylophilaceae bacterium]|nr:DUF2165 domain-containing protein [Methylophilaceae bacterium]
MKISTAIRAGKIALVFCIGLFSLLVGINNVVDYPSNFLFVQHVLSMDTVFSNSVLKNRAITAPLLHHLAYGLIIFAEFAVGMLCLLGAAQLLRHIKRDAEVFHQAKLLAVLGLSLGFILWFFGFMTVGAEWFLMWQSEMWNGQESAFRVIVCIGIVLLFIIQHETNTDMK